MREILFKAKRVDNGEWVEGALVQVDNSENFCYIMPRYNLASSLSPLDLVKMCSKKVSSETLCEYTGLTDNNGKRIWENDIVRELGYKPQVAVVKFGNGYYDGGIYPFVGWYYQYSNDENVDGQALYERIAREDFEVIGNSIDNPELLTTDLGCS
jgi:uncharacterized phage protein (TIGR01671 family)